MSLLKYIKNTTYICIISVFVFGYFQIVNLHYFTRVGRPFVLKRNVLNRSDILHDDVIVIVLSARYNFEQRKAIRQTWARNHTNVKFIIGNLSCPYPEQFRTPFKCELNKQEPNHSVMDKYASEEATRNKKLLEEANRHGDVLLFNFVDVYSTLQIKIKFAFEWVIRNTNATWIMKVDDDSVAFIYNLYPFLKPFDPHFTIIGNLFHRSKVLREGKWNESRFRADIYPTYPAGGSGYVLSRDIVAYITNNKDKLYDYNTEDVCIGIWMAQSSFITDITWIKSPKFTSNKKCLARDKIVVGHRLKPEDILKCFPELIT